MRANSSIGKGVNRARRARRCFSFATCTLCFLLSSASVGALPTETEEVCPNDFHVDAHVTGRDAALVVDGQSGHVLYARNSTAERHPASLTKMMTLYLLF